jgi:hypothetical protein
MQTFPMKTMYNTLVAAMEKIFQKTVVVCPQIVVTLTEER